MSYTISSDVLQILRCPISHTALTVADEELVDRVVAAIDDGALVNRIGETVSRVPDAGLLSEDDEWFYPVHDNIPCLIPDEAIELRQLASGPDMADSDA